jgi:hypothetical protein
MNVIPGKNVQCIAESGGSRWKLPALMGLSFAVSESALCILSAVWKRDWLLFAVSLCGPIAMGAGVYLTLKSPADPGEDMVSMARMRDQSYRFLLILSSVYVVTYGFYYAVVQILLREGTGLR